MIPFPDKKYSLIYADPPWKYSNELGAQKKYGAATSAYSTLKLKDICKLPVANIADSNCTLAMWTTAPKQREAYAVLDAWGFKYVTFLYVWVKLTPNSRTPINYEEILYADLHKGRGQYTKPNVEVCMLARKGYALEIHEVTIPQVIVYPVGAHSAKPLMARKGLEYLFGNIPRIELFARGSVEGWDTWGDET